MSNQPSEFVTGTPSKRLSLQKCLQPHPAGVSHLPQLACKLALPHDCLMFILQQVVCTEHACLSQQMHRSLQGRSTLLTRLRTQAVASSQPETAVSTTIVLKQCELSFGDTVKAVGDSHLFGSWDTQTAPELHWQEGHDWEAQLDVPSGDCTFKVRPTVMHSLPSFGRSGVKHLSL